MPVPDLRCIEGIYLSDVTVEKRSARADVRVDLPFSPDTFRMRLSYDGELPPGSEPDLRMAFLLPLMNYLMFTSRMEVDFQISRADSELLRTVSGPVSSDILANRILRPGNEYLVDQEGMVNGMDPQEVLSSIPEVAHAGICASPEARQCEPDPSRFAVLSSGGKESLLSYGLLRELGLEAHPVYAQESGGHWRTGRTAYEYHLRTEPNTTRVWTNIDRFYAFMLDRLDFIRRDWRRIRSDMYPIRLFTFPHYSFSALPIMKARGLDALIMGSEFDDPFGMDGPVRGIQHHCGIYDQTAGFDALLTAYLHASGRAARQFSLVRPITGFVEERILGCRYPDLLAVQRSCHSCRCEGGSMLPCGNCSKCRGILLFLLANGMDPASLGYRPADIGSVRRGELKGLKIDPAEREHAMHLLGLPGGQCIDHVECVHQDMWDLFAMPPELKNGLERIYRAHTAGTARLVNGEWETYSWPSTV